MPPNENNNRRATHFKIFRSLWLVSLFVLVGKSAVALKDITIAYRFGVNELVDIYLAAFLITSWLPIAWAGVLNYAITTTTGKIDDTGKRQFFDEMTGLTLCAATICTGLILFLAVYLNLLKPPELSAIGQTQLKWFYIGFAPVMFLLFLYAQYAAQLLSMEKHSNTVLDAIPPAAVAFTLLFGSRFDPVYSIIVASLIGGAVQVVAMIILLRRNQVSIGVKFGFKASAWTSFKGAFFLLIAGQIIFSFTSPIDLYFAGQLGEGNLANYGYAQRIILFLFSFATIAIMRGFLPVLSKLNHESEDIRSIVRFWSYGLLALSIAAVVVGWLFSPLMVSIIYERGAFNAQNTTVVSQALKIALLQLPFFFSAMVYVQYFASLNSYKVILHGVLISVFVKIATALFLVERFGLPGLMATSMLMYLITWLYYVHSFRKA